MTLKVQEREAWWHPLRDKVNPSILEEETGGSL